MQEIFMNFKRIKLKVINSFNIVEARNKVMAVEEYLQLLKPSYLAYFLPK